MKYLMILALLFSSAALAGSGSGKVTTLFVHDKNNGAGVIFFGTENNSNKAACSTAAGGGEWAFDLNTEQGQAMYSMLLTAATSGFDVTVSGKGSCGAWGDREEPRYILVRY